MGRFMRCLCILIAILFGSRPIRALAQMPPASPPLNCVAEHGAWCVLDGVSEKRLVSTSGTSAFRLSDPSQSDAALIVISPATCGRVRADRLSLLSFDHGQRLYGQDWEKIGVRLRGDGRCDIQVLLPEFSSNPFEWAFSTGLQLIRACESDGCDGRPVGVLKPAFELRYRAALPIARPAITK